MLYGNINLVTFARSETASTRPEAQGPRRIEAQKGHRNVRKQYVKGAKSALTCTDGTSEYADKRLT